jgi:hypothetical protein
MGLFDRLRPGQGRDAASSASPRKRRSEEARAVREHLQAFVRTRPGVEAFVEPPTAVLPPTVLLVASTGEWTRRRVTQEGLVSSLGVPVYDARLVGYPQRMRDWNERVKRGEAAPPDVG